MLGFGVSAPQFVGGCAIVRAFVNYVIVIDCWKGATTSLSQMDFIESIQ